MLGTLHQVRRCPTKNQQPWLVTWTGFRATPKKPSSRWPSIASARRPHRSHNPGRLGGSGTWRDGGASDWPGIGIKGNADNQGAVASSPQLKRSYFSNCKVCCQAVAPDWRRRPVGLTGGGSSGPRCICAAVDGVGSMGLCMGRGGWFHRCSEEKPMIPRTLLLVELRIRGLGTGDGERREEDQNSPSL